METPVTQYKVKLRQSDGEMSNKPQPQKISDQENQRVLRERN